MAEGYDDERVVSLILIEPDEYFEDLKARERTTCKNATVGISTIYSICPIQVV